MDLEAIKLELLLKEAVFGSYLCLLGKSYVLNSLNLGANESICVLIPRKISSY